MSGVARAYEELIEVCARRADEPRSTRRDCGVAVQLELEATSKETDQEAGTNFYAGIVRRSGHQDVPARGSCSY